MSSAGPEDDRTVIRPLPAAVTDGPVAAGPAPGRPAGVPSNAAGDPGSDADVDDRLTSMAGVPGTAGDGSGSDGGGVGGGDGRGGGSSSASGSSSATGSNRGSDSGAPSATVSATAGAAALTAGDPAPVLPGSATAASSGVADDVGGGNALPAGTRLGEFELTGVLGEGGFGIVYTAQDHSLQRRVAIKEYMPQTLASRSGASQVRVRLDRYRETFDAGMRSFINEARLLAQFDHPALVKVYRFWEAYGTAYMVMPLFQGITLKEKLKQLGAPPDEGWLMAMLAPLTEALAVLHRENCFHRDIAPDNVILLAGSEQRPLLLDFGAARQVISDMTQALTVILKPGYAPVEQYAEVPEMKQGPWTDVYALAATVHFAVTGKVPPASVGRLMNDNYRPLAETAAGRYGDGFLRAIDRALAVRPADRTPGIDAFRADLGLPPAAAAAAGTTTFGGAATGMPAVAGSATAASRPTRAATAPSAGAGDAAPAGRGKGRLVAAVAAVVVVGGGAAAWLLSAGQRSPDAAPALARAPAGPAVAPAAAPTQQPPAPATPNPSGAAAAPQVTTAAAPAAAARGFDIRDEFNRVLAGQAGDFKVTAAPSKPSLRIGRDKLAFNVTSARDGFVQVLVLGPDGSLLLLFPNAQASDNRIKAGQTLKLPQPKWLLDTVEPAGAEEFLVVVSAQPRDYADLTRERDYIFLKLPTGSAGAAAAAGWTRSTPLLLGGLKACPTADCEAYGAATFSVTIEH